MLTCADRLLEDSNPQELEDPPTGDCGDVSSLHHGSVKVLPLKFLEFTVEIKGHNDDCLCDSQTTTIQLFKKQDDTSATRRFSLLHLVQESTAH